MSKFTKEIVDKIKKIKRPLKDYNDDQILRLVREYLAYCASGTLPLDAEFRIIAEKLIPEEPLQLLGMQNILGLELAFRFNQSKTLENLMN